MASSDLQFDPKKQQTNLGKHGISFHEANTVLDDPFAMTARDYGEYDGEQRYLTIGMSNKNRLLIVCWTIRDEDIRIISSRLAEPNQRRSYEKKRSRADF